MHQEAITRAAIRNINISQRRNEREKPLSVFCIGVMVRRYRYFTNGIQQQRIVSVIKPAIFLMLIVLTGTVSGCSTGQRPPNLQTPAAADAGMPWLAMTKPQGNGPFPAVVLVPGCSGFDAASAGYDEIQKELTQDGFLVARADYLAAHGEKRCDGGAVGGPAAAETVVEVVAHLRSMPSVNAQAINLLGWSYGGGAILRALGSAASSSVASAITYYPACEIAEPWQSPVPTLVLFGTADNVVSLDRCQPIFAASPGVTLKTYAGAYHGFDNANFDPPMEYRFGTLGYDAAAATAAHRQMEQFLRR